jgi:hypothetical protein
MWHWWWVELQHFVISRESSVLSDFVQIAANENFTLLTIEDHTLHRDFNKCYGSVTTSFRTILYNFGCQWCMFIFKERGIINDLCDWQISWLWAFFLASWAWSAWPILFVRKLVWLIIGINFLFKLKNRGKRIWLLKMVGFTVANYLFSDRVAVLHLNDVFLVSRWCYDNWVLAVREILK